MQRSAATVVCLVGEGAPALLGWLSAPNVSVAAIAPDAPPVDRARFATEHAGGVHAPYFVHDADPLDAVAQAWVRLFDEAGPIGELEVATADALARWRARTVELPDYYLVTDVDALGPTSRHWYFGVLHTSAPARVVPVGATAGDVLQALDALATGPWWPPLDRLLAGLEHRAPEVVAPAEAARPATPTDALLRPGSS